jgi:hypothetical protein
VDIPAPSAMCLNAVRLYCADFSSATLMGHRNDDTIMMGHHNDGRLPTILDQFENILGRFRRCRRRNSSSPNVDVASRKFP